jgi:hypothetical protein
METIHTIITNAHTLANAPIDWSPTAGPIWLVGMTIAMVVGAVIAGMVGARQERQVARQALYRQAERIGALRTSVRETV